MIDACVVLQDLVNTITLTDEELIQIKEISSVDYIFSLPGGIFEPQEEYDRNRVFGVLRDMCERHGFKLIPGTTIMGRCIDDEEIKMLKTTEWALRAACANKLEPRFKNVLYVAYVLAYYYEGVCYDP